MINHSRLSVNKTEQWCAVVQSRGIIIFGHKNRLI